MTTESDSPSSPHQSSDTIVKKSSSSDDKTQQRPSKDDATRVKPSPRQSHQTSDQTRPHQNPPKTIDETQLSDAPITKIDPMERTPRPTGEDFRELEVGSVIRERFVLREELGRGGMGAVYRALDLVKKDANDDNPYVALKLLSGDFRNHPHAFITLQREAKKTQELAHPNIVTAYDFDRDDDVVFLTMEQLSGSPLIDIIKGKTERVLDYKTSINVIIQIARGLAYAHEKGIVHSDLKPANLFLTDDGVLKILDFGIARAVNQKIYGDHFDAGALGALTMSYASPEMIRSESPHPSDDIYALGIIACELLGGFHPFDRKDAQSAFTERLSPKIPEIRNPFLRRCIVQCLSLERNSRIESGAVFLKRFNNAASAPKRIATFVSIGVIALVLNFAYIQSIEVESIPFSSLPPLQQQAFKRFIQEGNTALKFQDLQGAVVYFNSAYEIHQTNDDIQKARESIRVIFQEQLNASKDEKTLSDYKAQIEQLKAYPAFKELSLP